jgi:lipoate---protein ligase
VSTYKVYNSGLATGQEIIDRDWDLLLHAKEPTLHFGRFSNKTMTYGCDMNLEKHVHVSNLLDLGITPIKRITPGGALYHLWDLVFSVIIPFEYMPQVKAVPKEYQPFYTFRFVNSVVKKAVQTFLPIFKGVSFVDEKQIIERDLDPNKFDIEFCMGKTSRFDILIEGKKIGGSAQQFSDRAFIHNGTISICAPDKEILMNTLKNKKIVDKMIETSFCVSNFPYTDSANLRMIQSKIEYHLFKTFELYPLTLDNYSSQLTTNRS